MCPTRSKAVNPHAIPISRIPERRHLVRSPVNDVRGVHVLPGSQPGHRADGRDEVGWRRRGKVPQQRFLIVGVVWWWQAFEEGREPDLLFE